MGLERRIVARGTSWLLVLLALAAAVGILAAWGEATRAPAATDALPDGFESTTVVELSERLPESRGSTAVVLFATDGSRLSPAALGALEERYRAALGREGPPAGLVTSADRTAALGIVPVTVEGATEVRDAVEAIRSTVRDGLPAGVTAQVTGPAAIEADLAAVFDGADLRLLLATASVVGVLLILTYRSPVLWLVPLTVVAVADRLAAVLATHALAAVGLAWDESTVGILSVLVFGAGTDYALLLISRYRDELRLVADRYDAMRRALRGTAEAVLASAVTVTLGLLTLLLSLIPTTRGLGLACAVGVVVAATAALVVLPAALVLAGRWVFWPLVPRVGQQPLAASQTSLWHRVGERVRARPTAYVVASVVLLGALAAGITQIRSGLSEADQFLQKPEAIAAAERLAESFPAGRTDPTVVLTRSAVDGVIAAAERVDGVESATAGVSGAGLTRVDVVLDAPSGSARAGDTVARLRDALASQADTWVGGTAAQSLDAADATVRDRLVVIPLILGLVLVGLGLLLRSVVAPLLLVATVVGTYAASLGLSWWLFTGVLGFERLDSGVPLLAFLFLVALGVDYNIFLVTRAAEEARSAGHGPGFLRALTATGGVITSAGILLAAVFAVLGVLPLVVLAQLGVVIGVGVLLDTLLVRTVLVPALAWRLGPAFWWPRALAAAPPAPAP